MSSSDEEQPKRESIFTDEQLLELEEAFEIFDKDKDGKINVAEMQPLLSAFGLPFQVDELESMCSRLDQTGSGLFKYDEFLPIAEHFRANVNMEDQLLKAFQVFLDHEDDTRWYEDKLAKVLQRYGTPFTNDELKHLSDLMHLEGGPMTGDKEFLITDFIKMILNPKKEGEDEAEE